MENLASVMVDGSTNDLCFDYLIPEHLTDTVSAGCRVRIPLRNRQAMGIVVRVHQADPSQMGFTVKPVTSLVDKEPILTPVLLKVAHWMADYYLCSVESIFRAMIPQAIRAAEGDGDKKRKFVRLLKEASDEELAALRKRAARQADALEVLTSSEGQSISLADLTGEHRISRPSITALEKAGFVSITEESVARDPFQGEEFIKSGPLKMNDEQAVVLASVLEAMKSLEEGEKSVKPMLLHGVTGSGKTEVYLQAIQHAIDQGKGAIVLVPEISLTPQTADRFKQRFADIQDEVAILHSHLSQGERHDEWKKVLQRKARIVIGARSAIFAPVENLGLIVVDEEHENSYKQETVPRYQARDIAVLRAYLERCPVVLGSATPALESWKNVESGKYQLAQMKMRIDDRALPLIRVIDMRMESRKQSGGLTILSTKLRESMEKRLVDGEQTILFLNRRGFSRSLLCPDCGYVSNCRHCSLTLTFHRNDDRLVCHLCGYSQLPPRQCPECSSKAIVNSGFGTERVEDVLRKVFTSARIARVDTDTMRKKNQLKTTLDAFKAKKIDILIGTQMIAKGLHFPNVTLVGILNADVGLHIPDFRAGERTFQLLTQVAGRAGRGELEGEVVVQTFTPHHPAVQFGRHHDFVGFAQQELEMRKQFHHPPYLHMAVITARSAHQERAEFSLKTLHTRLKRNLPTGIALTEPLPSPLVKSHDQWRFQVILKAVSARTIARHVRSVLADLTFPDDVIVTIDIDPYNLS